MLVTVFLAVTLSGLAPLQDRTPSDGPTFAKDSFPLADTSKDGQLTFNEYSQHAWADLLRRDRNHDGRISPDEFAGSACDGLPGACRQAVDRTFIMTDLNHDGFLDRREVDRISHNLFNNMDKNGDHLLSWHEYGGDKN